MDNKSCFRLMYTTSRQSFSSISIQYDNYLAWEKMCPFENIVCDILG